MCPSLPPSVLPTGRPDLCNCVPGWTGAWLRLCVCECVCVCVCVCARAHSSLVLQSLLQSPLLFSLYVGDVDFVAEGCTGAVTGTEEFHVSHLMFADDLTLLSNCGTDLQRMLNRLREFVESKHLIMNTSKSEVVHFNSKDTNLPTLRVGEAVLQCRDSFKYLGMIFYKSMNMVKSSEFVNGSVMAASGRIQQFVSDYDLESRQQSPLWLGKTYLVPTAMYGSQVWGTEFLKQGSEFKSQLQVRHLAFLKRSLGVKRTTCNWTLLRECGHLPCSSTGLSLWSSCIIACLSATARR